jgi:hypothetical protein
MKLRRQGVTIIGAVAAELVTLMSAIIALTGINIMQACNRDVQLYNLCSNSNVSAIEEYQNANLSSAILRLGNSSTVKTVKFVSGKIETVTLLSSVTMNSGTLNGNPIYVVTVKTKVKEFPRVSLTSVQVMYRGVHVE